MIPDGFQYFLDHFWNFRKCAQLWTLASLIYYRNTLNHTRIMDAFINILTLQIWGSIFLTCFKNCVPTYQKKRKLEAIKNGNENIKTTINIMIKLHQNGQYHILYFSFSDKGTPNTPQHTGFLYTTETDVP